MYGVLTLVAGLLGIWSASSALAMAWAFHRGKMDIPGKQKLLKWTYFDMSLFVLFGMGMMFLLVDFLAVFRDRSDYPFYHYGYLLSGMVFSLMSMLFMALRLGIVLRLLDGTRILFKNDQYKPK